MHINCRILHTLYYIYMYIYISYNQEYIEKLNALFSNINTQKVTQNTRKNTRKKHKIFIVPYSLYICICMYAYTCVCSSHN